MASSKYGLNARQIANNYAQWEKQNIDQYNKFQELQSSTNNDIIRNIPLIGTPAQAAVDSFLSTIGGIADFAGNPGGVGDYINEYVTAHEMAMGEKPEASFSWDYFMNGLPRDTGGLIGSMASLAIPTIAGVAAAPVVGASIPVAAGVGGVIGAGGEALAEGGSKLRESLSSGDTLETAQDKARSVAGKNFAMLAPLNLLELGTFAKAGQGIKNAYRAARGAENTAKPSALGNLLKGAGTTGAGALNEGYQEYVQEGIQSSVEPGEYYSYIPGYGNEQQNEAFKSTIGPMLLLGGFGGGARMAAGKLGQKAKPDTMSAKDMSEGVQSPRIENVPSQANYTIADEVSDANLSQGTESKLRMLDEAYYNQYGQHLYVTSMTRHWGTNSDHETGSAFDVADDGLANDSERRQWIAEKARQLGLNPLDEYENPSSGATGGHMHFSDKGGAVNVDTSGWSGNADIDNLINENANKYGVDAALLAAIAEQESGFNQGAQSEAGAVGIMQLMPPTAEGLGVDATDLAGNIEGGAKYIRQMLDQFGGDVHKALEAYNGGTGGVGTAQTMKYADEVMQRYDKFKAKSAGTFSWSSTSGAKTSPTDYMKIMSDNNVTADTAGDFLQYVQLLAEDDANANNEQVQKDGAKAVKAIADGSPDVMERVAKELGYGQVKQEAEQKAPDIPMPKIRQHVQQNGWVEIGNKKDADEFARTDYGKTLERVSNTKFVSPDFNAITGRVEQRPAQPQQIAQPAPNPTVQNETKADAAQPQKQPSEPAKRNDKPLSNAEVNILNSVAQKMPQEELKTISQHMRNGEYNTVRGIIQQYNPETALIADNVGKAIAIARNLLGNPMATQNKSGTRIDIKKAERILKGRNLDLINRLNMSMGRNLKSNGEAMSVGLKFPAPDTSVENVTKARIAEEGVPASGEIGSAQGAQAPSVENIAFPEPKTEEDNLPAGLKDKLNKVTDNLSVENSSTGENTLSKAKSKDKPATNPTDELLDVKQVKKNIGTTDKSVPKPQKKPTEGKSSQNESMPPQKAFDGEIANSDTKTEREIVENIENGKKAIKSILENHNDVPKAMHRDEVGYIDFVYGKEGTEAKEHTDGYGISKILLKHGKESVDKIPEVIAKGKYEKSEYGDRAYFYLDGYRAVIRFTWDGKKKTWLVTNFMDNKKKNSDDADAFVPSAPTTDGRNSPSEQSSSTDILSQDNGKLNTVITDDGKEFTVAYRIMPAEDVVASNLPTDGLPVNKDYPSAMQPRNRQRAAMQEQTTSMSNNLRPADLTESRNLNQGAPVIKSDGAVLNGNGRTIAIQRAWLNGKADKYKQYLLANAEKLGINPADIENVEHPILVRVVQDKLSKDDIMSMINSTTGGQRMSPSEQAKVDSGKIKSSTLNQYVAGSDLTSAANRNFLRDVLADIISPSERNAYYSKEGAINQDGVLRAQRALFALAYGDDTLLDAFSEAVNEEAKNFSNALKANAPLVARLQQLIKTGNSTDLGLQKNLVSAVKALKEAVIAGKPAQSIWQEMSMFEDAEHSPETLAIARAMDGYRRSDKKLTQFVRNLAELGLKHGNPNQTGLFGEEAVPQVKLTDDIATAKEFVDTGNQMDMFAPKYSRDKNVDNKGNVEDNKSKEKTPRAIDDYSALKKEEKAIVDKAVDERINKLFSKIADYVQKGFDDVFLADDGNADINKLLEDRRKNDVLKNLLQYTSRFVENPSNYKEVLKTLAPGLDTSKMTKEQLVERYNEYRNTAKEMLNYGQYVYAELCDRHRQHYARLREHGRQNVTGTVRRRDAEVRRFEWEREQAEVVTNLFRRQETIRFNTEHSEKNSRSAFSFANPDTAEELKSVGDIDTPLDRLPKLPASKLRDGERKIQAFGKAIGVPVHFVNHPDKGYRGVFTHNGEVYINRNAAVPVKSIFLHEFTHWLKASGKENRAVFDALAACVERDSGLFHERRLKQYRDRIFGGERMTDEEIIEEIICDAMGNSKTAEQIARAIDGFAPELNLSIWGRIKAMWDKFCQMVGFKQETASKTQKLPNGLSQREMAHFNSQLNILMSKMRTANGKPMFKVENYQLVVADNNQRPAEMFDINNINDYTPTYNIPAMPDFYSYQVHAQREAVRQQYEGTKEWMKAPNGKPTNLTEEQWLDVRTPNFKAWFGDWENNPENASKVVDENGEPLVVYHGSESQFDEFDTAKARANMDIQGMFFSPIQEEANDYGENVRAFFLNIKNPADYAAGYNALNNHKGKNLAGEKARNDLMENGYDGVNNDGEEYIAFNPNQIKSATENTGAFSPDTNNIKFSRTENNNNQNENVVDNQQGAEDNNSKPTSSNITFDDIPQRVAGYVDSRLANGALKSLKPSDDVNTALEKIIAPIKREVDNQAAKYLEPGHDSEYYQARLNMIDYYRQLVDEARRDFNEGLHVFRRITGDNNFRNAAAEGSSLRASVQKRIAEIKNLKGEGTGKDVNSISARTGQTYERYNTKTQNVLDMMDGKHSEQGAFSDAAKNSRDRAGITPSTDSTNIFRRAVNALENKLRGKTPDNLGIRTYEDVENDRENARRAKAAQNGKDYVDRRRNVSPFEMWWTSPQRLARKIPVISSFVQMAKTAVEKQEKLRVEFNAGMNEIEDLLGYSKWGVNDKRYKERKMALQEALLQGDINRKVFTDNELSSGGLDTETIKAYHKMRELLDKAYTMADQTYSRTKYVSRNWSTAAEADGFMNDLMKKNPFVQIIQKKQNADGTVTYTYKEPHQYTVSALTVTAAELEELKKNKDVIIASEKLVSGTTPNDSVYRVTYHQKKANLGKIQGYIPHIFHGWLVCEVDKNGNILKDSAGNIVVVANKNSMSEATKEGKRIASQNADKHYMVMPKLSKFNDGAAERAAIMGDFDYSKTMSKVANGMKMSIADAERFMKDTVSVQNRGRFLAYAQHRKGVQGYEQNVFLATQMYFNQIARYIALDPFKRNAISAYNRLFGSFTDNSVMKRSRNAKYVYEYINDMNGVPNGVEVWMNDMLHNMGLGQEVANGRPALWLEHMATYPMTIAKLGVFNVSSALLNLTQLFNLYGAMGEKVASGVGYERLLKKGFVDARKAITNKNSQLGQLVWKDLGLEAQIGIDVAGGYSKTEVSGLASLTGAFSKLAGGSMYLFRLSDTYTRAVTLLTAYNKALDEGKTKQEAIEYAKEINDKVNFDYSIADAPGAFRAFGPLSKVLLQFKKYPVKQLELFKDIFDDGRAEGLNRKKSALRLLKYTAPYMAFSGMMGIPFISLAGGILSAIIGAATGDDDWDWQQKIKQYMIERFGENNPLTLWWLYGGGALIGINMGSRVGVGDFMGLENREKTPLGSIVGMTTLTSTIAQTTRQLGYGNYAEAIKAISPAVGNVLIGAKGEVHTTRGRMKYQYQNAYEQALRMIGLNPLNETMAGDIASNDYAKKQADKREKDDAIDDFLDEPTAENAARLNELGVTPKSIQTEMARRKMNRAELNRIAEEEKAAKAKKSKQKKKQYSASDYLTGK